MNTLIIAKLPTHEFHNTLIAKLPTHEFHNTVNR